MDIDFPILHLVRSRAYYLVVATYLIPPSGNFAVAFTTVVLPVSPKVSAVEGVSAHVYR